MTKNQKYIIVIIIIIAAVLFFNQKKNSKELPIAIGEPLELVVVQKPQQFKNQFYTTLESFLTTSIGPSPQPETVLRLMQINEESFKGVLKRHQNLLIVSRSDSFSVNIKKDVFAVGQRVILIGCPSYSILKEKKQTILDLVEKIKKIEIDRMSQKLQANHNKEIYHTMSQTHGMSLLLPKDFFLAYGDQNVTWARKETPKISQGILMAELDPDIKKIDFGTFRGLIDSITTQHIFGPKKNSYMITEKEAPIKIDTIMVNGQIALRAQSLWRMENDFMGGIYSAYFFNNDKTKGAPKVIYTYLYAPGEKKRVFLLQLESIIYTLLYN